MVLARLAPHLIQPHTTKDEDGNIHQASFHVVWQSLMLQFCAVCRFNVFSVSSIKQTQIQRRSFANIVADDSMQACGYSDFSINGLVK